MSGDRSADRPHDPGRWLPRWRAIPEQVRPVALEASLLAPLGLPVGLAFLIIRGRDGAVVAFFPSAAGVAEAPVDRAAWAALRDGSPTLATLHSDVEALLVLRPHADEPPRSWIVGVDVAYGIAGRLRRLGSAAGVASAAVIAAVADDLDGRAR